MVKDDNDDEDVEKEEDKTKTIMETVKKGKAINFSDYVDREVPYIKNNTVAPPGDYTRKEFDTKLNNKTGLFSRINEPSTTRNQDSVGDIKYI